MLYKILTPFVVKPGFSNRVLRFWNTEQLGNLQLVHKHSNVTSRKRNLRKTSIYFRVFLFIKYLLSSESLIFSMLKRYNALVWPWVWSRKLLGPFCCKAWLRNKVYRVKHFRTKSRNSNYVKPCWVFKPGSWFVYKHFDVGSRKRSGGESRSLKFVYRVLSIFECLYLLSRKSIRFLCCSICLFVNYFTKLQLDIYFWLKEYKVHA